MLIVDPQPTGARLLSELMRDLARSQVITSTATAEALEVASNFNPQLVFVELAGPSFDGLLFTKALRRSSLACREAPVIMATAMATAGSILGARDAGVHEFLRKPFTTKDLVRRLVAVTQIERMWVEAVNDIGPDRRRFNSGEYAGTRKRRSDPRETSDAAKIIQALQVLKAAVGAVTRDPAQALRSMQAQAADLKRAAEAVGDAALSADATAFQGYLASVATGPLNAAEVAARAAPLLARAPAEASAA